MSNEKISIEFFHTSAISWFFFLAVLSLAFFITLVAFGNSFGYFDEENFVSSCVKWADSMSILINFCMPPKDSWEETHKTESVLRLNGLVIVKDNADVINQNTYSMLIKIKFYFISRCFHPTALNVRYKNGRRILWNWAKHGS